MLMFSLFVFLVIANSTSFTMKNQLNEVKKQTSENVSDKVRCFFRLAKIIAETASLELVAKGIAMKERKKEGICVASEKL